ncbi:MAG: ParB/RepB/Spo0J family partition protein [Clostridiaceae bacterium]|nr:ParB/RepB/Spo0J family partition protein [Clostridiaceae bacterium]
MSKKRLGRGLEALLNVDEGDYEEIKEIKINDIEPNIDQPRKSFDEEKLKELAESIKKHGIVQPIIVKKVNDTYRIVAGERRWRAAKIANLDTVKVIVKDLSEQEIIEVALIENLQREDLNSIEEAEAYEKLIKEHGMKQEEIAEIVGKSRPAIANTIRLLSLPEEIKKGLIEEKITSGHARALLSIEDSEIQKKIMEEIIRMNYNVRQTEKIVKEYVERGEEKKKRIKTKSEEILEIEEMLKNILGTKVQLNSKSKKGKIIIEYYSNEELERIIDLIKGNTEV